MGIRSFLGICEHKWRDTGANIELRVGSVVTPSNLPRIIGHKAVCECQRCGVIRSFQL